MPDWYRTFDRFRCYPDWYKVYRRFRCYPDWYKGYRLIPLLSRFVQGL